MGSRSDEGSQNTLSRREEKREPACQTSTLQQQFSPSASRNNAVIFAVCCPIARSCASSSCSKLTRSLLTCSADKSRIPSCICTIVSSTRSSVSTHKGGNASCRDDMMRDMRDERGKLAHEQGAQSFNVHVGIRIVPACARAHVSMHIYRCTQHKAHKYVAFAKTFLSRTLSILCAAFQCSATPSAVNSPLSLLLSLSDCMLKLRIGLDDEDVIPLLESVCKRLLLALPPFLA